mmetsp:Transcript_2114/g.3813  ORF Transcript_2114/g.3813 Transcript_2114/m.3813 type:complete len:281 (-) Transcript_2114:748-1590(-)
MKAETMPPSPTSVGAFAFASIQPGISFEHVRSHALSQQMKEDTTATNIPMNQRSHVLRVVALAGNLCAVFLRHAPPSDQSVTHFWSEPSSSKDEIGRAMSALLVGLLLAADNCSLILERSILKKIQLNAKKYPAALCKGKSDSYTAYSSHTGITKTEGQSTMEEDESKMALEEIDVIEQMMDYIHEFALERQWNQFHTPRSLCLALMGEAGELAEIFQWKGDENMKRDEKMLDKVSQEMADVAIYLLRMATVCKIPLADLSLQPVVFAQVQSLSPSSGSL